VFQRADSSAREASRGINEINILCNSGENTLLTMFVLSDRTRHAHLYLHPRSHVPTSGYVNTAINGHSIAE
jgi:hypothetical protein